MKKIIIGIVVIILIALGAFFIFKGTSEDVVIDNQNTMTDDGTTQDGDNVGQTEEDETMTVIGSSVEGRDIIAYHYGTGDTELLFVGGIHGGYEWNTVLVTRELMSYLESNPTIIPENVKVTVIPVLNPDGLEETVGTDGIFSKADVPTNQADTVSGRFNANNVDLNRNFDCDWQSTGTWQNKNVDGGDSVFSEPESKALKDYVEEHNPSAAVVYYSSAGGVFASSCHNGVSNETNTLTQTYAEASGYPAFKEFNFYEITGDAVNWLAKNNIPAISVLLTTHDSVEWDKNKKGIDAVLEAYTR